MAKEYAKAFYNGKPWRTCSKAYLISQHYICERCGGIATLVHHKKHITPQNIYDLRIILSWDNLEAVCDDCHNKEHKKKKKASGKKYLFDSDGNITPPHSRKNVD